MNAKLIALMLLGSLPMVAGAGNNSDDLTAYPAAEDGVDRMVFRVPAVHDESILKIEIIVGKTLSVDCNRTSFSGALELRIADGWGYPYFVLEKMAGPMSTRMVCPPETQHVERFVLVTGDGNELSHSFVTAAGEWMTEDFVPFTGTLSFTNAVEGLRGRLIFKKDNPTDHPELDDATAIPVIVAAGPP